MIIINHDNFIENKEDLFLFFKFMDEEVYDEESERLNITIKEYLSDLLERMKLINMSLHERISYDLMAYAIINFEMTADFTKTEVQVFSKNEGFEIKERDKLVFEGIVERYFKGLKSLWDRFMEIDVE